MKRILNHSDRLLKAGQVLEVLKSSGLPEKLFTAGRETGALKFQVNESGTHYCPESVSNWVAEQTLTK